MRDVLRTKVTRLIPEKPSLTFQEGLETVTLEFDSRNLYEQRKSRFASKSSVWLLHDLSPLLTPQCSVSKNLMRNFYIAIGFALSAIVFWFSAVNPLLPLLAPVLGLVTLVFASLCAAGLRKKFWVCINDDDGLRVTRIRLKNNEGTVDTTTRQLFENTLSEAIEAAKQQEYYNFD